jgi:hypothetical protein
MKSQDIVILLKLVSLEEQERASNRDGPPTREDPYSVRSLGASLGISKSEVNASINRSCASGLALKGGPDGHAKPNRRDLCSFIIHGLKFVFPAKPGAMTRGVPTAFSAPMLEPYLVAGGSYIYVWPYAYGNEMGQAVDPLFKSVPDAVQEDEKLYEYLALIDAIRLGRQREAKLASDRLSEKLLSR